MVRNYLNTLSFEILLLLTKLTWTSCRQWQRFVFQGTKLTINQYLYNI